MSRGRSRSTPPSRRRPGCEEIIKGLNTRRPQHGHSAPHLEAGRYSPPGRYWHVTRQLDGDSLEGLRGLVDHIRKAKPDFKRSNLKLLSRSALYGILQDVGTVRSAELAKQRATVDSLGLSIVTARIKEVDFDLVSRPNKRYWRVTAAVTEAMTAEGQPYEFSEEQRRVLGAIGTSEDRIPMSLQPPRLMLGAVGAEQNFTPGLRRMTGEALEAQVVTFEAPRIEFN